MQERTGEPVGTDGTAAAGSPPRTRLTADDRRDQILKAGRRLFADRPYAEVSTTDVAEAAGTIRTNVHYHFGTKRGLYLAVLRQFGQLAELPQESAARMTGPAELDRLFARWLDVLEANPEMIRMTISALAPGADPEVAEVMRAGLRAWEDRLLFVLALQDTPTTRALVRSFQGLVSLAVTEWLDKGQLTKEQVLRLMTKTLLAALDEQRA